MTKYQTLRHGVLDTVARFGEEHRQRFEGSRVALDAFAAVAAAAAEMTAADRPGPLNGVAPTRPKAELRRALTKRLNIVAHTCRIAAAMLPWAEAVVPRRVTRQDAALQATVREVIRRCEAVSDSFVPFGLPPTFVSELRTLAEQFEVAQMAAIERRRYHVRSRQNMSAAMSAGLQALRTLDVVVTNLVREEPELRGAWEGSRRVGRVRKARRRKALAAAATATGAASDDASPLRNVS